MINFGKSVREFRQVCAWPALTFFSSFAKGRPSHLSSTQMHRQEILPQQQRQSLGDNNFVVDVLVVVLYTMIWMFVMKKFQTNYRSRSNNSKMNKFSDLQRIVAAAVVAWTELGLCWVDEENVFSFVLMDLLLLWCWLRFALAELLDRAQCSMQKWMNIFRCPSLQPAVIIRASRECASLSAWIHSLRGDIFCSRSRSGQCWSPTSIIHISIGLINFFFFPLYHWRFHQPKKSKS